MVKIFENIAEERARELLTRVCESHNDPAREVVRAECVICLAEELLEAADAEPDDLAGQMTGGWRTDKPTDRVVALVLPTQQRIPEVMQYEPRYGSWSLTTGSGSYPWNSVEWHPLPYRLSFNEQTHAIEGSMDRDIRKPAIATELQLVAKPTKAEMKAAVKEGRELRDAVEDMTRGVESE